MTFFNSTGINVFQVLTSDANQLGDYTIQITGTVTEGPQKGTQANFRFPVHILPGIPVQQVENRAPYFIEDLPPIVQSTAKTGQFDLNLFLPNYIDPDSDNVDMQIDFGALSGMIVYDQATREIRLADGYIPEQLNAGFYMVFI